MEKLNLKEEITNDLMTIKAVQINPENYFTWTSGIQAPIYCDNRLTMSYPIIRKKITKAFIQMIDELDMRPDVIAGCATAGIPHAAWLADELNLPMVYVRTSAKEHGNKNQIEGKLKKGQDVLIIEDLISTGGSSIQTANALQSEGLNVINVFAIFTYGLKKASRQFAEQGLSFHTITSFDELISNLLKEGIIKNKAKEDLLTWRDSI